MRKGLFLDILNMLGLSLLLFTGPMLGTGGWNTTFITFGILLAEEIIFLLGMKIWEKQDAEGAPRKSLMTHYVFYLTLTCFVLVSSIIFSPHKTYYILTYSLISLFFSGIYLYQCH